MHKNELQLSCARSLLVVFGLLLGATAAQAETCNAEIAFSAKEPDGNGTKVKFAVNVTDSKHSAGDFAYSYIDLGSPNKPSVDRDSPSWNASNGEVFLVEDHIDLPVDRIGNISVTRKRCEKETSVTNAQTPTRN